MTNEKAIAEKLLQINAIKLSLQQPFTWASGWKSPVYCDNRKALSYPFIRDFIKSEMCNVVFDKFPNANLVAAVATAGIPWGTMVADQLKLPFIYVRPAPKEHGLGNQIEGFYEKGQHAVVIEDLISTGKSSLQVINILQREGLDVVGMASVFTYGFEIAETAFAAANILSISLTNYGSFIALAEETGMITREHQNTLLNWRTDPAKWDVY